MKKIISSLILVLCIYNSYAQWTERINTDNLVTHISYLARPRMQAQNSARIRKHRLRKDDGFPDLPIAAAFDLCLGNIPVGILRTPG